jgi:hypothetical protein
VANRPADAALIEERRSDGRGLLADHGVSICNLFSGDAPTSLMTMSGLRERTQGLGPSRSYAAFFTHPAGFLRAVILTVGEMVKEVFQARRQVRRGVEPRIDRHGSYVALRAVTNVFLRDLNVALVVEAMMRGAKSIYVDFVDYDEIAHHAGVIRPESLASLYGLDEVLAGLEQVARSGATPRPYEIVLVSDHGQSQGATFRQRYGQTLEKLVAAHMSGPGEVAAATAEVEAYGPVNVLLGQLSAQDSVSGRLTRRAMGGRDRDNALGPSAHGGEPSDGKPPLVVVGSGNLGGIWFAQHEHRLTLEEIEALHPGLVQALADHEGVSFVVVMTGAGPVAVGRAGTQDLATGAVVGQDPLARFGLNAREDFLRVASFDNAPDVYVNSLYDTVLDEVAAFEEPVGCHGGLGGWQTRPILVHPAALDRRHRAARRARSAARRRDRPPAARPVAGAAGPPGRPPRAGHSGRAGHWRPVTSYGDDRSRRAVPGRLRTLGSQAAAVPAPWPARERSSAAGASGARRARLAAARTAPALAVTTRATAITPSASSACPSTTKPTSAATAGCRLWSTAKVSARSRRRAISSSV